MIVDAAGQLPPASNLRRFIGEGAELVTFSGGKAIGGPQGSGILAGKRDLIMSALLQQLDLDIYWEQWNPPDSLIDKHRLKGAPQHGVGRPCKVGKETIVGLLVALRRFTSESDESRTRRFQASDAASADLFGRNRSCPHTDHRRPVPKLELQLANDAPRTALELCVELERGNPSVYADPSRVRAGIVSFSPWCLRDEDPEKIAARVKPVLRR